MTSGRTVVGKGETGEFGKWKSRVIAVSHVVAWIRVPVLARARPGTPHGLLGGGDGAQPSREGLQPWESHRWGCVERRMLP
jgi:hypothetical protein